MSTSRTSTNGNAPTGSATIELQAAMNGRWMMVDLDEILEGIEFAGLPQRELIVTYLDGNGRRRYVERCPERKRRGRRAVTA